MAAVDEYPRYALADVEFVAAVIAEVEAPALVVGLNQVSVGLLDFVLALFLSLFPERAAAGVLEAIETLVVVGLHFNLKF